MTSFRPTQRQLDALDVLNRHRHVMLYGGARSGKSVVIVRNLVLRALKRPSKHLMVRLHYNHARVSLGLETMPFVLRHCFPGLRVAENRADGFWSIPTLNGGESTIWLGGTDDHERMEKHLGREWSTIYLNEASELSHDAVTLLRTRLAENSGLPRRMWYDCNPSGKRHWTYQLFEEGRLPDGRPHDLDARSVQINPVHNQENLPPEYMAEELGSLVGRDRQRFLEGRYQEDVPGALWSEAILARARARVPAEPRKFVIAVDPSVSANPGSDECGIVVASRDSDGGATVHADLSKKLSTDRWARRVAAAYHEYRASVVVAESNQGGTLISDSIGGVDPSVKVELIHASVGKLARAEPVSMMYEQEKITHRAVFPELEAELVGTDLRAVSQSPNRLDALVYALTWALEIGRKRSRIHFATFSV